MEPSRDVVAERWPLLGILIVALVLFSRAVFGGAIFFYRDISIVWYARTETMVRAVAEGAWPLWDPYSAFGGPSLADPSYQLAYPLTWLNLILLPATYYRVYVLVHTVGAGVGLYFLARRWGLSRPSAFVAAVAWISSGPFLSGPNVLHHFAGLAWMPWVLLALDVALKRASVASALVLGATVAAQVLAGSGDILLMTGVVGAAYSASFLGSRPGARRPLLRTCAFALAFALLLSAVQWLPTADVLRASARAQLPAFFSMYWSLHPASLVDLLVPGLTAEFPLSEAWRGALFESRAPFLLAFYLGMTSLALVLLSAALPVGRPRVLFLAAFVFCILCAVGRHTPFYRTLMIVPPFSLFRYPMKYLMPAGFLWACLAGMGVEAWRRPWSAEERQRSKIVVGVLGLVALAAVLASEWPRWHPEAFHGLVAVSSSGASLAEALAPTVLKLRIAALLALSSSALLWARGRFVTEPGWILPCVMALVVLELVHSGRSVNSLAPPELMALRPQALAHLGPDVADHRIFVVQSETVLLDRQLVRGPRDWDPQWSFALAEQEMMWPPSSGRWRLYGSYDGDFTGLAPPPISLITGFLNQAKGTASALKLLRMGNVAYVVSVEDESIAGLERVAEIHSVFASPIRIFRVPDPLPRAYVVDGVRIGSHPRAYPSLVDFDPHREVILPEGPASRPADSFSGGARILWRRADALAVEAEARAPGVLVVVEGYESGWTATLDGAPAPILPANLLFRAVRLPAGRHVVEMRYRPRAAVWGAALSAAGLLVGLAAWGYRDLTRTRV